MTYGKSGFMILVTALFMVAFSVTALAISSSQVINALEKANRASQTVVDFSMGNDFTPGSQIIFYDTQSDNQNDEFPQHWDLQKGNVISAMQDKQPVISFRQVNSVITPQIQASPMYLPERFSLDFSYFMGDKTQHYYYISFWNKQGKHDALRVTLRGRTLSVNYNNSEAKVAYGGPGWKHIGITYQYGTMKIYDNGNQVLVIPDLPTELGGFSIWGGRNNPQDSRAFIRNVRLAGY